MFNTVLELLKKRNYKAIREIFMDMNEADVAALLQQFYDDHEVEKYELPLLFRLLNKDVAADVFRLYGQRYTNDAYQCLYG